MRNREITKKEQLVKRIKNFPSGSVFSIQDLNANRISGAYTILSRLTDQKFIQRVSGGQGLYCIPKSSSVGFLKPNEKNIIKCILNKRPSYLSGDRLYNKLGLTTQVPRTIVIVSDVSPNVVKIENLEIQFRTSKAPIKKDNIKLLQYLDVLMNLKKIPASSPNFIIKIMKNILKKLNNENTDRMAKLSTKYPKRVQALLGAILQDLNKSKKTIDFLRKQLNIETTYNIGLKTQTLPSKVDWNIK